MMKYKVLKDFHTSDGVLYGNEIVKEWASIPQDHNLRVKDNMGRIWTIPKDLLKEVNNG